MAPVSSTTKFTAMLLAGYGWNKACSWHDINKGMHAYCVNITGDHES